MTERGEGAGRRVARVVLGPAGMQGKDVVDAGGFLRFHRAGVACAMSRTDAGLYWGHLGIFDDNDYHGRLFVVLAGVRLYRIHMPRSGNSALDNRWWLGFEGSYSFDATLADLKRAADRLGAANGPETQPMLVTG